MKQVLCSMLALIMVISCLGFNSSVLALDDITSPVVCPSVTLENNFEEDCILISIRSSYSEVNRVWTASQLGLSNVVVIEDLTAVAEGLNADVFANNPAFEQMLKVYLNICGKQQVLNMMDEAIKSPYVSSVSPSFIYEDATQAEDTVLSYTYSVATATVDTAGECLPTNVWNAPKWELYDIGIVDAWDEYGTGSSNITVAVIDSGIASHEDLDSNIVEGRNIIDDGMLVTDDTSKHGTFVAGLIGAVGGNDKGVTGVCWSVSLMPLRVSANRTFNIADVTEAIMLASLREVNIINMSLGITIEGTGNLDEETTSQLAYLERAMALYDGLIVCAAGNDESEIKYDNDSLFTFPAVFDLDDMIVVGATCKGMREDGTISERKAKYSNYSSIYVDIFAPGGAGEADADYFGGSELNVGLDENGLPIYLPVGEGEVSSTLKITSTSPYDSETNSIYSIGSGTSYAAPLVTGAAALLLSHNPHLTAEELKYILMNTVDTSDNNNTLEDLSSYCASGGRLNVYRALQTVLAGDETRTVVSAVEITSETAVLSNACTLYYDAGRYTIDSITPQTYVGISISTTSSTNGQIGIECTAPITTQFSGRLVYCRFNLRQTGLVLSNDMILSDDWGAATVTTALLGDVNNDNQLTTADGVACMQLISGTPTVLQLLAADYDGDGVITQVDAELILSATL